MSMRKREEIQKVLRGLAPKSKNSTSRQDLVRIAGIHCCATKNAKDNLDRYLKFAEVAVDKSASLLMFPENFLLPWIHTLDFQDYRKLASPLEGELIEPFRELSESKKVDLLCPFYELEDNSTFLSTAVIRHGEILDVYRKTHLTSAPFWEENRIAEAGDELKVFDLGYLKVGVLMGWDIFFPEAVRTLVNKGAEMIFVPSAAAMASKFRWLSVLVGHAVCNNCFMVRINRNGKEGDLDFYGESFCVDPFGNLLEKPTFSRDAVMISDLNLEDVQVARDEFTMLKERRPDLYSL